jgi:hypothetical protein
MRKHIFFLFLLTLLTGSETSLQAQKDNQKLRNAEIGIYVKYLTIEEATSTFRSDAYYWISIRKSDNKSFEYYRDSLSALEFINAVEIIRDDVQETKWIIKNVQDTFFYKTGMIRGVFSYNADFRNYPQDTQEIPFIIESPLLTAEQMQLRGEEDPSYPYRYAMYIDSNIEIRGRSISNIVVGSENSRYNTDFGDKSVGKKEYARYTATFFVQREYTSFLLKILIPNILLLVIAYLVFFIPANELEVAVGCTVTSLLASIALKWTIDSTIPNVGYTTSTDQMFYLFYFLITLALVQTVITYNLRKRGKEKLERNLDLAGRYLYPSILILGLLWILI